MRSWVAIAALISGCCCFGAPSASLCADACRERGECSIRTERAGDGAYRCYAATDEQCRASEACARSNRCFVAEGGECVTVGEVESRRCAISTTCRVWGGCHPRDGFCEPQSEPDCRASLQCRTQGRCTYDPDRHHCMVDPAACAFTTGCELEGLCAYEPGIFGMGGTCVLGRDGDCTRALACTRDGRCAPRTLEGCSEGCRVFYCGRPEWPTAPSPCVETQGSAHLVCDPDGRCMRNASGECEHVP